MTGLVRSRADLARRRAARVFARRVGVNAARRNPSGRAGRHAVGTA